MALYRELIVEYQTAHCEGGGPLGGPRTKDAPPSVGLTRTMLWLLTLVCTGTALSLLAQIIVGLNFHQPSAQLLAWAKYASVVALTSAARRRQPAPPPLSRHGRTLLLASGCLDVFAYCSQCVGFALCGVPLAVAVLPAACQTATATLSRALLGRRLSPQQLLAVVLVNAGLLLRALAPQPGLPRPGAALRGLGAWQLVGICALAASAVGHALLGVAYELLLRAERPPPPYAEYMARTSRIGLAAATLYQVGYTLPRWRTIIAAPLAASGVPAAAAAVALAAFGAAYNAHAWVQARVFAVEGVVAVGLANALRGGVVSLAASALFCEREKPWLCSTVWTQLSAAIIALGAALWVTAKLGPTPRSNDEPALCVEKRD